MKRSSPPDQTLLFLFLLFLWTVVVGCDIRASLPPPVHLSGEGLGWTVLVCLVTDLGAGHLEVTWGSPGVLASPTGSLSFSVVGDQQDASAAAVITVATDVWPSYSCLVTHRRHARVVWTRHVSYTESHHTSCHRHQHSSSEAIGSWTDHVTIQALRLLLLKTVIFNFLVTTLALSPSRPEPPRQLVLSKGQRSGVKTAEVKAGYHGILPRRPGSWHQEQFALNRLSGKPRCAICQSDS